MHKFQERFNIIKESVNARLRGSRRKDGGLSSEEKLIRHNLTRLEALIDQKVTLLQAETQDEVVLDRINQELDTIGASFQGRMNYQERKALHTLLQDVSFDNLSDVLISQADGSRGDYLGRYVTGLNGLSEKSGHTFSIFSSQDKQVAQARMSEAISESERVAVESHRLPIRAEVVEASRRIGDLVEDNFGLGEPHNLCVNLDLLAKKGYARTNQVNVRHMVEQLGLYDDAMTIMKNHRALFIPPSGMGHLPPFLIDRQTWSLGASDQVIKGNPTGTPFSRSRIEGGQEGFSWVNLSELKETLVDFAFLVAAIDLNKPVYGSCQGAHVGWLLAGGEMLKWDKYNLKLKEGISFEETLGAEGDLGSRFNDQYGSDERVSVPLGDKQVEALTDYAHATVMYHGDPSLLEEGVDILVEHVLADRIKAYEKEARPVSRTQAPSPVSVASPRAFSPTQELSDEAKTKQEITEQTLLEVGKHAVEYFTYKSLHGTQSHFFKHLEDPNACAFVLKTLGLGDGTVQEKQHKASALFHDFKEKATSEKVEDEPFFMSLSDHKNKPS